MRKTKIIATIGPASRSPETLDRLVAAGMDVARLNFRTVRWKNTPKLSPVSEPPPNGKAVQLRCCRTWAATNFGWGLWLRPFSSILAI